MARVTFNGPAGDVFTNDTEKVLYQFVCQFSNSCGTCIQYAHAIGPYWPIPLHRGCRCQQRPLPPGTDALPFVDFMEEIRSLSPQQQAVAVGASNWKLIEAGVVDFGEVVTPARVRDLREVVSRNRLTIKAMTKAGVGKATAQQAYRSVRTPEHVLVEARRRELVESLAAKGLSAAQVKRAVGRRVATRGGLGTAPGPKSPTKRSIEDELGVTFTRSYAAEGRDEVTVIVDVARLDRTLSEDVGFHVGPGGTGPSAKPGSYRGFREFLDKAKSEGTPVEMPSLYFDVDGKPSIGDGRHRFAVFRDMGVMYLPVTVPPDDAARFRAEYGPGGASARLDPAVAARLGVMVESRPKRRRPLGAID